METKTLSLCLVWSGTEKEKETKLNEVKVSEKLIV